MNQPPIRQPGNSDLPSWIACEIHDGILPWVTGAMLHLEAVRASPETQGYQETALISLRHAVDESRALINFLEKQLSNQELSLSFEIQKLVDRITPLAEVASQSISILGQPTTHHELKPEQVWSIVRIVQQSLQNAIQHAGEATIHVDIQSMDSRLVVEVTDTGMGFEPAKYQGSGFGIRSMTERARTLHGNLELNSAPGMGTQVRLVVPVSNGTEAELIKSEPQA